MTKSDLVAAITLSSMAMEEDYTKNFIEDEPKPHWKETQSQTNRETMLKKAQEKRDRKANRKIKTLEV